MNKLTECKYKCSYTFNYNVSNLNMINKGSYIKINYDKSTGKQVVYNNNPYSVYEVRFYVEPIIKVGSKENGNENAIKNQGQLIIFHTSDTSSLNLIVVVPIRSTNYLGSSLLNNMSNEVFKNVSNNNDSYSSRLDGFTLEKLVPKKPFMSYSASADFDKTGIYTTYNFIEFDNNKGGYTTIYSDFLKKIRSDVLKPIKNNIIDEKTIQGKSYNKKGPTELSDSNEIYIDCQPVYDNTVKNESVIFKDAGEYITETNKYAKMIYNLILPVLLTCIIFIVLYKGFQSIVGTPPSKVLTSLNRNQR